MAYADFALWNYFEGKKKATIWIVESLNFSRHYLLGYLINTIFIVNPANKIHRIFYCNAAMNYTFWLLQK
jgi:hypothetical protein